MPVPYDHASHQAGLNGLAALLGQPAGNSFVENAGGCRYCIVTIQLATQNARHRQLRLRPPPNPGPAVGPPDVFEDRLDSVIMQGNPGAIRVHRRVYVVPYDGVDGEPPARALWTMLQAEGTTQQQPQPRLHSWLAGDAIYIHFPADDGIGLAGAVVPVDGALLPDWP